MPSKADTAWLQALAKWQGKIDTMITEVNKNQDELDVRLTGLWEAHAKCREQILTSITELRTIAKQEGKRWGVLVGLMAGILSGIIVGAISALIMHMLGSG